MTVAIVRRINARLPCRNRSARDRPARLIRSDQALISRKECRWPQILPMKALSANQYTSRTSASVFARNGIPCLRLESLFRTSYALPAGGAITRGGFPVRATSSGSVSGKKGGGNFLGTPDTTRRLMRTIQSHGSRGARQSTPETLSGLMIAVCY